ncbi:MAG: hypothetical protein SFY56_08635 [Bacteroidota bacterium]|nr:hypothetical protein [Bacteroidota bacterium]
MKKLTLLVINLFTLSIIAQKEIVLPEDSTKRTWDFFKYFTPPNPGSLNDVVEPEGCLTGAEATYKESFNRFDKLWSDYNSGAKSKKKIKQSEKGTENQCNSITRNANSYYTSINTTSDKCIMARYFFTIKGYKEYCEKAKELYPSNTVIAGSYETISEIVSKLGNKENLKAIEEKTKADKLAKVEPPQHFGSNLEWEKWFKDYFTKEYVGYTFIKQYLRSKEWSIHRNELTSVIIDRQIASTIAAKKPDGTCVLVELALYQDYSEGKYGSSYFLKSVEAQQQILCDKLK